MLWPASDAFSDLATTSPAIAAEGRAGGGLHPSRARTYVGDLARAVLDLLRRAEAEHVTDARVPSLLDLDEPFADEPRSASR